MPHEPSEKLSMCRGCRNTREQFSQMFDVRCLMFDFQIKVIDSRKSRWRPLSYRKSLGTAKRGALGTAHYNSVELAGRCVVALTKIVRSSLLRLEQCPRSADRAV